MTTTLQNIIETNIATCENPKNRVITECEFYVPNDDTLEIWIRSNYDGWCEDVKCIYTYHSSYGECCTFTTNDFIGLTEEQANQMLSMSVLYSDFIVLCDTGYRINELIDEELPFN